MLLRYLRNTDFELLAMRLVSIAWHGLYDFYPRDGIYISGIGVSRSDFIRFPLHCNFVRFTQSRFYQLNAEKRFRHSFPLSRVNTIRNFSPLPRNADGAALVRECVFRAFLTRARSMWYISDADIIALPAFRSFLSFRQLRRKIVYTARVKGRYFARYPDSRQGSLYRR